MQRTAKSIISFLLILSMAFMPAFSKEADAASKLISLKVTSSVNETTTIQFPYSDNMFERNNKEFYHDLSMVSLGLSMAGFTAPECIGSKSFNGRLATQNIRYAYDQLGFKDSKFYNYDIPLNNCEDKVAFSFASKRIKTSDGKYNTVLAVVIRGGNYGGEWASNLRMYGENDQVGMNVHYGFRTAASEVYTSLNDYIDSNFYLYRGDVKLWITGFSRAAAVANVLTHMINNSQNGDTIHKLCKVDGVYSYNFACPASAKFRDVNTQNDGNIWAVISPSDIIPMAAFRNWGYTVYGNAIYLNDTMDKVAQDYFDKLLKGTEYEGVVPCSPKQSKVYQTVTDVLSDVITEVSYSGYVQQMLVDLVTDSYLSEDTNFSSSAITDNKDLIHAISEFIKYYQPNFDLEKNINGIIYAHFPEHYLSLLYSSYKERDKYYNDLNENNNDKHPSMPADVNNDGKVTLEDVVLIQLSVAKLTELTPFQNAVADVNRDNKVSMEDAVLIQRYIAQLINSFD